jgi:hypothetical protein
VRLRIAADIDELARARSVEELEPAQVVGLAAVCVVMDQRAASVVRPVMDFVGRRWPIAVYESR